MKSLCRKWIAWFRGKIGAAVEPPATGPVTPATPDPKEAALSEEVRQGFTHGSTVDCTLTLTGLTESSMSYAMTGCTWLTFVVGDATVQGISEIWRKEADGSWRGGKWDFFRPGSSGSRDFANLLGAEYGQNKPTNGQTIAFLWTSKDKTKRSNAVFSIWKGG
jgi:hypothetical protein